MVDSERFVTPSATVPAVPKYLLVPQKEGDFAKVSLFFIQKAITGCAGSTVQNVSKVTAGLLVGTLNDQQDSRLFNLQKVGHIEVEVP